MRGRGPVAAGIFKEEISEGFFGLDVSLLQGLAQADAIGGFFFEDGIDGLLSNLEIEGQGRVDGSG